ncbi:hypothetical protein LTR37_013642 [Vermiconidia calcicola]|uniref:Uncharacterized protein n=1 Tax=Vermiconidia calcicola TaxID=1690605 RepID=A0ACC3MXI1_9PEZI|nr:hypothetical protein LTR37_013642 [Vermiconidia calcicola]
MRVGKDKDEGQRRRVDVELAHEREKAEDNPNGVTVKQRISHFTWPWFSATMATGGLASVISQTPNRFTGLQTIGKIFFIVDLIMFVTFNIMIGIRFFRHPHKLVSSLHHPVEGLFFGAYWVSVALILSCCQSYGVPNTGPWLVTALRVLFWMYCVTVSLVAVGQYYVLFQKERLNVMNAMPAWIFPIYPLLVIGPLASNLIPSQSQPNAYPIWVGAVMLQGLAWTVAIMMYSIFTQRLMGSELPSPPTRPGMFVSVGPAGYTAAGIIGLATLAPSVVPPNAFNTDGAFPDGDVVKVFGIIAGIFVLLFSFWFFCISAVSVIAGIKHMSFTLNWWAFIFPNAGLTLAVIQLGSTFKSPGINGFCSFLTIMLVILWLITAVSNVIAVVRGTILWPGKDEDS